jgi:hypothetical protein
LAPTSLEEMPRQKRRSLLAATLIAPLNLVIVRKNISID